MATAPSSPCHVSLMMVLSMDMMMMMMMAMLLWSSCNAEIVHFSLHNDTRGVIDIHTFGFTSRGHMDLEAVHLGWIDNGVNDTDPSLLGFLLITDDQWTLTNLQLRDDPAPDCALQTFFGAAILTFKDFSNITGDLGLYNTSVSPPNPDLFSLVYINCNQGAQVSMDVTVSFYNLEGKDGRKNYLSDGLTQLPVLYFSFSAVHFMLFCSWMYVCLKQRQTVHSIHILMGALLFLKAFYLFSEGGDQAYMKQTGVVHGWEIVMYIFGFLKGIMLFTVIILIGTGWSILRPHLHGNEKWVLMIVIPLQVLANIAEVLIGESGPFSQDWLNWGQLMFLIDVICCCAVLLPIIWSIKRLRRAAQTDGKAATNLMKLTLFRQYYMVVVCYIYFTRIVVVVIAHMVYYRYTWISVLASEMATLAFYVFTGYKFRPAPFNPYFMLEDEEHVVEDLKDDEFEL